MTTQLLTLDPNQLLSYAPARAGGLRRSVRITKRLIDVSVSGVALLLCFWAVPLIAAAIYVDSPGPVFYKQRRAGRLKGRRPGDENEVDFETFDIYKFRTMRTDAEKFTGAVLASENDPRVTRIGRILRKTRLDELPQLWNILKGDMTLVGPRPERPELFRNLILAIPFFEERMRGVKPGLTGFAQISLGYSGRAIPGSEIATYEPALTNPFGLPETAGSEADDMRMKLLFDLAYVTALEKFRTYIALELMIIIKTPWVMLRGLGR
jgi:lipopolysaccharide/colanic/teichoic acid biosynthesis glycosyltransferase